MDTILIRGLRVMACHGVLPEEKTQEQPFILDLALAYDLRAAGRSDALADSIHYGEVAQLAVKVVQESKAQLLERVAEEIAQAILARFPAQAVTVRLKKPEAPVPLSFDYMGVEITRSREVL